MNVTLEQCEEALRSKTEEIKQRLKRVLEGAEKGDSVYFQHYVSTDAFDEICDSEIEDELELDCLVDIVLSKEDYEELSKAKLILLDDIELRKDLEIWKDLSK